ncbi:MAG: carbohydrate ABC transporter permease [Eubacteriales bacterium]|nr:carbohydrate ABC transporter permease [Eubacteriales bacterium]
MTRTLHGSRAARWKEAGRIAFLTALSLIMFFPIFWMVLSSVKAPSAVIKRSVFWPCTLYWENYVVAFNAAPFGRYFINSFTMAALTVMAQVITGSLAGFGFAKMRFRLNKPLFLLFLCSMMIPSEATIISNYLTISAMGLLDTYLSVIITSFVSVFAVFLFRQFYMSIDNALLEAARIDGAGEMRIYLSIILPLSKSAMATVAIIGFIGSWNSYLWPLIIVNSAELRTVQTGLRTLMLSDFGEDWGAIMAAASMTTLPVVILFICLQRYFVQGITRVGLK